MAKKFYTGVDLTGNKGVNFADPSAGTDAVNLQTLQNYVGGLAWKDEVRVATTTNGTLATAYANAQTIDGVVLATGNRILLKNQTTQTENGIYTVNASGAPTRAIDADTTADLNNATVSVTAGTANAGTSWIQTTQAPTVGSSNIVFAQFNVGIAYTADGNGIELVTNQFQLELDGTSLSKSATGLRIGSAAAANGLIESSGLLSVGAGTGIIVNANDVAIDPSVVVRKYSATFGNGSATTFNMTHGLGTQVIGSVLITRVTDGEVVDADVFIPPAGSTIDITFAVAPTTNQYRVTATA